MDIEELTRQIGTYADESGWSERFYGLREAGDEEGLRDHVLAKLALVDSEVAEAVEEIRDGRPYGETYYNEQLVTENGTPVGALRKPEGVPSELADVIIRVLHLCWMLEIDIKEILEEKLAFNRTRGVRHGGKMA